MLLRTTRIYHDTRGLNITTIILRSVTGVSQVNSPVNCTTRLCIATDHQSQKWRVNPCECIYSSSSSSTSSLHTYHHYFWMQCWPLHSTVWEASRRLRPNSVSMLILNRSNTVSYLPKLKSSNRTILRRTENKKDSAACFIIVGLRRQLVSCTPTTAQRVDVDTRWRGKSTTRQYLKGQVELRAIGTRAINSTSRIKVATLFLSSFTMALRHEYEYY